MYEMYVITEKLNAKIFKNLQDFGHIVSRKLWKLFRENYFNAKDVLIAKPVTKNAKLVKK